MSEPPTSGGTAQGDAANRRAILHPRAGEQVFAVTLHHVPAWLEPSAEYAWVVEWDVPPGRVHHQRVLASPCVHLSLRPGEARLTGLLTRAPFGIDLRGRGRVLGLRFRPGAFRPWLGRSVATLANRQPPLTDVLAVDAARWSAEVRDAPDRDAAVATLEHLRPLLPAPDPLVPEVEAIVEHIRSEPKLTRVSDLATRHDTSVRALQRLFREYVGAGPKWVIQAQRLIDVAGRAAGGVRVDWAATAVELGYSDQAHLIRAFTRVVGQPPSRYARAQATRP